MIVVVPGTWWRSRPDWAATYHLDSKPMREIASLFGDVPHLFSWSGENSPGARHQAAADLARFLSDKSDIHLLGFSHGGNIASEAACACGVRTLVTIATPVTGRYPTGGATVHLHLYTDRDRMQRGGGEWLRLPRFGSFGWARRTYPSHTGIRNIRIRAARPSGGVTGSHGDILWWDETWLRLRAELFQQEISPSPNIP